MNKVVFKKRFNVKKDLFSDNEQGLWLDPSDMTSEKAAWRRNLLLNTEALSLSPWTADGATFSANTTVAPNGTTTAGTFTGASGNYRIYQQRTSVVGESHTISLYVKQGTSPTVQIDYINVNNGPVFTFATESFSSIGGFTTNVQNVGSGWYRLSVTATNTNSNPGPGFRASGATTFFIWGVQYEQSSTPTDYQPITDFSTEFKAAHPTHTLYQDSNGVTPCTAAGHPVGLILDQSRGGLGALGSNLTSNFASSGFWSIENIGVLFLGSAMEFDQASIFGNDLCVATTPFTSGRWYQCTSQVSTTNGGGVVFDDDGSAGGVGSTTAYGLFRNPTFDSDGPGTLSFTFFFRATASNRIRLIQTSPGTVTITSLVIREVPGNHAFQTTSASRPTLARIPSSGRRNLLIQTEGFDGASWGKAGLNTTGTPQWIFPNVGPNGSSAFKIILSNGISTSGATSNGLGPIGSVASGVYRYSIHLKSAEVTSARFRENISVGSFLIVNLTNGTITGGGGPGTQFVDPLVTDAGDGWWKVSFTTPTMTNLGKYIVRPNQDGDNTSGILATRAQLELGSTATNYQKVVATTDVTESGVSDLWHLVFDGSDDSLVTNAVDFTATDEMTVIAGMRKLSDAAYNTVVDLTTDPNSITGAFAVGTSTLTGDASRRTYGAFYFRTAQSGMGGAIYAAPTTNVVTALFDASQATAATQLALRIDGAVPTTDVTGTSASAGNFANAALYIGRRNQASFPFSGHIYQLIVRGKTTPTGKLLEAERYTARKTGVSFNNNLFDIDAQAYITAVESADAQALEAGVKTAINDFVVGCKADGIWDAIKASCILAGARTLTGALVPLKGTAPTSFNFVVGDYDRATGLVGDGSTKYLDSNRNNNTDPQDSFHLSVYASSASQAAFNNLIGTRLPTDNQSARALHLNTAVVVGYANFSGNLATASTFSSGFVGVRRATSTSATLRVAAVNTDSTSTSTSVAPNSLNIPVFARRTAVSTLDGYSNARLAFYSIGESLDLAQLDARVTTLIANYTFAINTGLNPLDYDADTIAYINAGYAAGGTLA